MTCIGKNLWQDDVVRILGEYLWRDSVWDTGHATLGTSQSVGFGYYWCGRCSPAAGRPYPVSRTLSVHIPQGCKQYHFVLVVTSYSYHLLQKNQTLMKHQCTKNAMHFAFYCISIRPCHSSRRTSSFSHRPSRVSRPAPFSAPKPSVQLCRLRP